MIKTKLSISYLNVLFTTFELRNELQTLSERIMTIVRRENNIAWSKHRQLFEKVLKRSHEIFRGVVNRSHFIELQMDAIAIANCGVQAFNFTVRKGIEI